NSSRRSVRCNGCPRKFSTRPHLDRKTFFACLCCFVPNRVQHQADISASESGGCVNSFTLMIHQPIGHEHLIAGTDVMLVDLLLSDEVVSLNICDVVDRFIDILTHRSNGQISAPWMRDPIIAFKFYDIWPVAILPIDTNRG